MERIWAPWRMTYIGGNNGDHGCVFCLNESSGQDEARLVLHRSQWCFVMINRYPYTNGHLLVCPYRHTSEIESLSSEEMLDMFTVVQLGCSVLQQAVAPQGINIGMNLGKSAGAGVDQHLHMHIVPRWTGDTNFMTVVAGARVVPESLQDTYSKLKPLFDSSV
jgi:ATP adenylyltransferase